jgi:hypothetical protein
MKLAWGFLVPIFNRNFVENREVLSVTVTPGQRVEAPEQDLGQDCSSGVICALHRTLG